MANSGLNRVVRSDSPLDRQTSLVLTTSSGGYVKTLVYKTPINSAEELVVRIIAAAGDAEDSPGIF